MQRLRRLASVCALGSVLCTVLCILAVCLSGSAAAQGPPQRIELQQLMLELINEARREAGAPAVRMGVNGAAQLHAEQMVAECYHSHWGRDGLKPYTRYSLLGGYQGNAENVRGASRFFGFDPCAVAESEESPDLEWLVRDAMDAWLHSPGHRRNLLDPTHRLVNVGIAWRGGNGGRDGETYIFRAVQHFEGDYARLDRLPSVVHGRLALSGRTVNGASLGIDLTVYYEPQPQSLPRAALDATGFYCGGYPVAAVFPSARWVGSSSTPNCVEPGEDGPRGNGELIELPTIVADQWREEGAEFSIRADLSPLLRQFGVGVYTIVLWGDLEGARVKLVEYSKLIGLAPLHRAFVYSGAATTAAELSASYGAGAVFGWDSGASGDAPDGFWRGYAVSEGEPIPGAVDFTIETGDWLWLTPSR